jgi:hypothetical protein
MLQTSIIGGLLGLCFESFLRAFIHHLETSGVRPSPEVGSMYGKKVYRIGWIWLLPLPLSGGMDDYFPLLLYFRYLNFMMISGNTLAQPISISKLSLL